MKKVVLGIILSFNLSLLGEPALANGGFTTLTIEDLRTAVKTYLASYDGYDDLVTLSLDDMVNLCIEKFNRKKGKFEAEDMLLIDGGIIDHYKTINRVTRCPNETAPIDLVMIRFAFDEIKPRHLGLSRETLINECIAKINWDGVKVKDLFFYFDNGFIRVLNKRITLLNSKHGQKYQDDALNKEMELLHIMLSLWDMNLPEEYKKELILITNKAPRDIKEAILKSKIKKFLPAGKYPEEYQSLVKQTISTILKNEFDAPKDQISQEKIVDLLVSQGFLYQLINDIDEAPAEAQETYDNKVAVVLLSDQVEKDAANYFYAGEKEDEWLVYSDHKEKIKKYNMELRQKRYTKDLQNITGDNSTDLYSLIKSLLIKTSDDNFVLTGVAAELLSNPTFYEYLNYELSIFPEGPEKDAFNIILFCTACISSWNVEQNNFSYVFPALFTELSEITTSFASSTISTTAVDQSISELVTKGGAKEMMRILTKSYIGTGIKK